MNPLDRIDVLDRELDELEEQERVALDRLRGMILRHGKEPPSHSDVRTPFEEDMVEAYHQYIELGKRIVVKRAERDNLIGEYFGRDSRT